MNPSIIQEQIKSITIDLNRRRFRGEDPALPLGDGESLDSVIAKVLAAQTLHAVLDCDGERFNPDETSAEKRYFAGLSRLDAWSFRDARRLFDDAAKRAREPALQQRVTLYRLLTDYLRDIVTGDVDRTLPMSVREAVAGPIDLLDQLAEAERAHYRREIDRLWELRGSMKENDALRTVWLFVQARIAMDSSESALGLTWLLAAAHLNRESLEPTPYLQGMLDRARRRIVRLIGVEEMGEPEDGAEEAAVPAPEEERVRPWDLFEALAAALEGANGCKVRAQSKLFRIERFVAPPVDDGSDG